ncbi:MAG TPA: hypothetical protein VFZ61_29685 [Polyangiales bacterium]
MGAESPPTLQDLLERPPALAARARDVQAAPPSFDANWTEIASRSAGDAGAGSVEERWRAGARDEAWSAQMTQYVQQAMHDLDVQGEVNEISCHTHLCRLRMSFAGIEEAQTLAEGAGQPDQRALLRIRSQGGGLELEIYLERPE